MLPFQTDQLLLVYFIFLLFSVIDDLFLIIVVIYPGVILLVDLQFTTLSSRDILVWLLNYEQWVTHSIVNLEYRLIIITPVTIVSRGRVVASTDSCGVLRKALSAE
jgi:SepF-like predicted cell division protein (DUF552 family)